MHRFQLFRALAVSHFIKRKKVTYKHYRLTKATPEEQAMEMKISEASEKGYLMHSFLRFILGLAVVALLFVAYARIFDPLLISYEYQALQALAYSFTRIWLAFVAIIAVSIPLTVYIIFMSRHKGGFATLFQIVASIPATIVLPLIVLAYVSLPMGNEMVALSVYFLSGIWYVIFSVLADAKTLPDEIMEVKRLFNVRGLAAWRKIYVMAILPGLITGSVTAIAAEWNASIVAEYFTSTGIGNGSIITSVGTGMGKLLDTSLADGNLALMALALLNLTLMIILVNTFVWKVLYRRVSLVYR
jgi:NitT/TauT family transport system permease protein